MATRHVALLRGINVGRAKRVAMADLREMLSDLGYGEVQTLLNSGNAVFSAGPEKPRRIGQRIQAEMLARLGVAASVTVLTAAEFKAAIEENTLAAIARDPARFLVAFCNDPSRLKELKPLTRERWSPEALAVGRVAAYLWCASGILDSPLAAAVGRVLGESTTARNWTTVTKIQAALTA